MPTILEDKEILHRSEVRGVVVSREQLIEVEGKRFRVLFWTQWETGRLHHVDSVPA